MYSELYTQSHYRFTKHLAVVALIVVVSTVIFFISQDSSPTRASRKNLVEHEIVNLTPQQVGIFWEADEADEGWVIYGENPNSLQNIALDERDIRGEKQKRRYHYAVLKNVQPNTDYYYKIVSDNELIDQENGSPFELKTPTSTTATTSMSPIYGKMLQTNGQAAQSSFAMVLIGNAYPLFSLSGNTGEWLIPMQYIINKQTQSPLSVTEDTLITIQLFDDESRSMVRSTISRSRPIPQPITLGNNYSFISETDVLSVQDKKPLQQSRPKNQVEIRFPKQGAVIPGVAPLIKGYGIPGKPVEARIDSKPTFSERVVVNNDGEWNIPVRTSISPGTYKLTIETENSTGDTVTMERDFTLIKSGERVLGEHDEATPSGTLTPTVVVTTATPTPTTARTPTPSLQISPTPILTGTVTATPAPPVSGMNIIPIMVAGLGMVALGFGVMLLL